MRGYNSCQVHFAAVIATAAGVLRHISSTGFQQHLARARQLLVFCSLSIENFEQLMIMNPCFNSKRRLDLAGEDVDHVQHIGKCDVFLELLGALLVLWRWA